MTKLPWGPDDRDAPFAMRQVVVSLRAHQKLTITHPPIQPRSRHVGVVSRPPRTVEELAWSPEEGATGTEVEATGTEGELDDTVNVIEKETVEYIVMQKTMQKGVEHEWKCIGFTEPTTVEIIKKMDEFKEREMEYNAQKAAASE